MIDLRKMFEHHEPTGTQSERHKAIREAGYALACTIVENAPACADTTAAIRKVREAVMTANAAIACEE